MKDWRQAAERPPAEIADPHRPQGPPHRALSRPVTREEAAAGSDSPWRERAPATRSFRIARGGPARYREARAVLALRPSLGRSASAVPCRRYCLASPVHDPAGVAKQTAHRRALVRGPHRHPAGETCLPPGGGSRAFLCRGDRHEPVLRRLDRPRHQGRAARAARAPIGRAPHLPDCGGPQVPRRRDPLHQRRDRPARRAAAAPAGRPPTLASGPLTYK